MIMTIVRAEESSSGENNWTGLTGPSLSHLRILYIKHEILDVFAFA
jgi:hypothetical protein